jgi:hypothetical protein
MGCWTLHKALDADEGVNNLFSVLSVSSVVNSAELGFDAQKNRPRSCDARAVGFSGNLLLGFFEGGLGGCEACHGDAER